MEPTVNEISLQKYWDMLNRHDWFYAYSDDNGVWKRGADNEDRLRAASKLSPTHEELWADFRAYHFDKKRPLPPRPEK